MPRIEKETHYSSLLWRKNKTLIEEEQWHISFFVIISETVECCKQIRWFSYIRKNDGEIDEKRWKLRNQREREKLNRKGDETSGCSPFEMTYALNLSKKNQTINFNFCWAQVKIIEKALFLDENLMENYGRFHKNRSPV